MLFFKGKIKSKRSEFAKFLQKRRACFRPFRSYQYSVEYELFFIEKQRML